MKTKRNQQKENPEVTCEQNTVKVRENCKKTCFQARKLCREDEQSAEVDSKIKGQHFETSTIRDDRIDWNWILAALGYGEAQSW